MYRLVSEICSLFVGKLKKILTTDIGCKTAEKLCTLECFFEPKLSQLFYTFKPHSILGSRLINCRWKRSIFTSRILDTDNEVGILAHRLSTASQWEKPIVLPAIVYNRERRAICDSDDTLLAVTQAALRQRDPLLLLANVTGCHKWQRRSVN